MAEQAINLSNLTLEQLDGLKQQVEEEVNQLTGSLQHLRSATARFLDSKESSSSLPGNSGKEILVPMTSSLYVKGKLANDKEVLVDIGTGYYVSKTIEETKAYADRKVSLIQEQVTKVQQALQVKRNNLDAVVSVMQQKIYALNQQQSPSK
eukprot:TRINITY_DN1252_c0_g1_i1.p1 TRINITY_DN1252_c0_g1~~TRINITY_DN1252_c0_g1_i1.p1  ORF type:complete len:151 (+),score=47.71 TRINITY_DN1252_c0_g1_i1:32-484(+)